MLTRARRYDVRQKCMTEWTKENVNMFPMKTVRSLALATGDMLDLNRFASQLLKSPYRVQGIGLQRESASPLRKFAVWSSGFLCFTDISLPLKVDEAGQSKEVKTKKGTEDTRLQFNRMYRPIVYMQQLGPREIVSQTDK